MLLRLLAEDAQCHLSFTNEVYEVPDVIFFSDVNGLNKPPLSAGYMRYQCHMMPEEVTQTEASPVKKAE